MDSPRLTLDNRVAGRHVGSGRAKRTMDSPLRASNQAPAHGAPAQPTADAPSPAEPRPAAAAARPSRSAQPQAAGRPILASVVLPAGPCAQKAAARQRIIAGVVAAVLLLGLGFLWVVDPARWGVPLCGLNRLTGLYCPGCGATRATHELLHGRLLAALDENALWVLGLPLVCYAAASEVRRQCRGRPLAGDPARNRWVILGAGIVVLLFGLLRNVPWEPFAWLAP